MLCASARDLLSPGSADLWHTADPVSGAVLVRYDGVPLRSRQQVWWTVRTLDAEGVAGDWAEPATFEIGLLTQEAWAGSSLVQTDLVGDGLTPGHVPLLRRDFELPSAPLRARLYVTALGEYVAEINGRRVSEDCFRPGWTEFHRRLAYQTYDVAPLLRAGANVLGALLGDGWYCGSIGAARQLYGERPGFLARLDVECHGGEQVVVGTDDAWRWAPSDLIASDHYLGETCDRRAASPGWSSPGFDDRDWKAVRVRRQHMPQLVAQASPPVRRVALLDPVEQRESDSGLLLDFGQNMAGRLRLTLRGTPGTRVTLQHAEALQGGRLWRDNLGRAAATDTVVLAGHDEETYEPTFTYHGFRYAQLTVDGELLEPPVVQGVVLSTDVEPTGSFGCSHPLITRLHANIQWGQRSNWVEIPTDCPQRDERLGWTGDIYPFVATATFNAHVVPFLEKWLQDLRDCQLDSPYEHGAYSSIAPYRWMPGGPAWEDAALRVPWVLHERYGDATALEAQYSSLTAWMGFLQRRREGRLPETWGGYGDWLSLDAGPERTWGWDDRFGGTPPALLRLAHHCRAAELMSRTATLLGRPDDAGRYQALWAELRAEFGHTFAPGGELVPFTQTAAVLSLAFGLLDEQVAAHAAEALVGDLRRWGHLRTGFVGTRHVLPVLRDLGHLELAYQLLEREDKPGWLYPVKHGATTVWERWDAWDAEEGFSTVGMNSLNHYAYGSVGDWIYQTVAGIRTCPEHPGFEHVVLDPRPGGSVTSAWAEYESVRGPVRCAWELGERFEVTVTVPAASWATLHLTAETGDVLRDGEPLSAGERASCERGEDGRLRLPLEPGTHRLSAPRP